MYYILFYLIKTIVEVLPLPDFSSLNQMLWFVDIATKF